MAPIVGHEAELITGKVYWDVKDAAKRKPTVDAFMLSKDVSELFPSVEDVKFASPRGPKSGRLKGTEDV